MREFFCEEMEHVAVIVEAEDEHDAAQKFAEFYGGGITVTYDCMSGLRGYPTAWFSVHDQNGEHVNDFMISDKETMDLVLEGRK